MLWVHPGGLGGGNAEEVRVELGRVDGGGLVRGQPVQQVPPERAYVVRAREPGGQPGRPR